MCVRRRACLRSDGSANVHYICCCQPDSSGSPDGLLAQRFERWVRAANDLPARFSVLTNYGACGG